jgi:ATP-dependent Lon protease
VHLSDDQEPEESDEIEEAMLQSLSETEVTKLGLSDFRPHEVFVLPLTRRPFFPGMAAPVVIEQGPYYEVLKRVSESGSRYLCLALTKDEEVDIYKLKSGDIHKVGVLARVLRIVPVEGGGAQVVLNMENRCTIKRAVRKDSALWAKIEVHEEPKEPISDHLKAYAINIVTTIRELLKMNPLFKEELQIFLGHSDFTEPGKLADFAVALTTASREELQGVLEAFDLQTRIDKALLLLRKELDLTKLQSTINQKIEATISKSQKEFFLREQLRTIKKELGLEKDEKQVDLEKFEARLEKREVPEPVQEVITEEVEKLQALEPMSAEYSVSRNYLDWLTVLPWGVFSEEANNLSDAEEVLEQDHYGLADIKKRILEFIAVGKLSGGVRGSIICLVGPPGVGKTSIGKSIARALNREFYRFSVGGMRDEVEIKGHRRTYIGAMPGKIVQALKYCKTMNPVIMLDEVDKMGSSFQGDPASALLEVLDPEQNKEFLDHYLDVRCDLSNVLFLVTANILDTIPEALRDRMDVLRLSGYILEEKVEIAKRYLVPRHRKEMGIKASQVHFTDTAIAKIINDYARESGVRSLEHNIKKILRKVAVKLVKGQIAQKPSKKTAKRPRPTNVNINTKNLEEYLGKPLFESDRIYRETPVGVVAGLAWTSLGGATLYFEATKTSAEKTTLRLTGQAGDVMKESSQIAWTYFHSKLHDYAPGKAFFKKSEVHMHIPEGAVPKDGPSAGVTMTTALVSLLRNQAVPVNLAMTGELTLTGKVLPVGGIKEKLIAARRVGLTTLIMPKDNRRDYDELPDYLKEGMDVHFVQHYDEVYELAFDHSK